jgi:uncharacterized protein YchJ
MDGLAVLCTSCKKLFFVDMPMFKGNGIVGFMGSHTNCPKCRKKAWIVDGEYVLENNVLKKMEPIDLRKLFKLGINEIIELKRVFEEIKRPDITKEEIKDKIQKGVPAAKFLINYLPKTSGDLAAWVSAIFLILTFLLNYCEKNEPKIINNKVERNIKVNNYFFNEQKEEKKKKTGVNDPCPCGSGKKHKKCCLNK